MLVDFSKDGKGTIIAVILDKGETCQTLLGCPKYDECPHAKNPAKTRIECRTKSHKKSIRKGR